MSLVDCVIVSSHKWVGFSHCVVKVNPSDYGILLACCRIIRDDHASDDSIVIPDWIESLSPDMSSLKPVNVDEMCLEKENSCFKVCLNVSVTSWYNSWEILSSPIFISCILPLLKDYLSAIKFIATQEQVDSCLVALPLNYGSGQCLVFRYEKLFFCHSDSSLTVSLPDISSRLDELTHVDMSPSSTSAISLAFQNRSLHLFISSYKYSRPPLLSQLFTSTCNSLYLCCFELIARRPSRNRLIDLLRNSGCHTVILWGLEMGRAKSSEDKMTILTLISAVEIIGRINLIFVSSSSIPDFVQFLFARPRGFSLDLCQQESIDLVETQKKFIGPVFFDSEISNNSRKLIHEIHFHVFSRFNFQKKFESLGISENSRVLLYGKKSNEIGEMFSKSFDLEIVNFMKTDVNSIFGKFVGSSEKKLIAAFQGAKLRSPCVFLITNIHLIAGSRDKKKNSSNDDGLSSTFSRLIAVLLTCLDGIDSQQKILFSESRFLSIVATSEIHPDELDPAITRPGRLETWIDCSEDGLL